MPLKMFAVPDLGSKTGIAARGAAVIRSSSPRSQRAARASYAASSPRNPADSADSADSDDSDDDEAAAEAAAQLAQAQLAGSSPHDVDSWVPRLSGSSRAYVDPRARAGATGLAVSGHAVASAWNGVPVAARPAAGGAGAPEEAGGFRGESLVGATVSVVDMAGQRAHAKVVMYVGRGEYMVRTDAMQFSCEIDAAIRLRECWVVSSSTQP